MPFYLIYNATKAFNDPVESIEQQGQFIGHVSMNFFDKTSSMGTNASSEYFCEEYFLTPLRESIEFMRQIVSYELFEEDKENFVKKVEEKTSCTLF